MEHIILQIALKLVKKTAERAYAGEIRDIDAMTSDILEDCKVTAITIVEEICKEMNIQIRKDKSARKEQGLVLKEKDRPRELLTSLGWLELTRDYYRDKTQDRYIYPLDHILGIGGGIVPAVHHQIDAGTDGMGHAAVDIALVGTLHATGVEQGDSTVEVGEDLVIGLSHCTAGATAL